MASPFIFPSITSLPPGYDCTVSIPVARIAAKAVRDGEVLCTFRVFRDNTIYHSTEHRFAIRDLQAIDELPHFVWPDHDAEWNGAAGFLEINFRSTDGEPMFRDTNVVGFYAIYSKPGKKSFFSDNAFRYGSPPIINQIAAFGQYVDAYPVIHIDRKRDMGETLTLINPYEKAVLATINTQDGRTIRRRRVNANSVLNIRLVELLRDDEEDWIGQLQLTATNRLVTFHVKHSLQDPRIISDHEHLDPFRSDQTHFPLTRLLRLQFGNFLKKHGWIR